MSNVWTIHVADRPRPAPSVEHTYCCDVRFEVNSWVTWLLSSIPKEARLRPDNPVEAVWVDRSETKTERDNLEDVIMVDAKWLKTVPLHDPGWHHDRIVLSTAATAYLSALPDDWPCFLYQT